MPDSVDHGPRISGAEYDRKVANLYLELPESPSDEVERHARRRELDLKIDHRLGIRFPEERREALWHVDERMSRRPLRMLLAWQIGKIVPRYLAGAARRLGSNVINEYRTVLTPQELELFFGGREVDSPGLPIDRQHSKRKP